MRIEICDCRVTLAGEIESLKVNKVGISVPEAMILNHVHGPEAVHNIHNIRPAKASPVALKTYLSTTYMRRAGDESKRDVAGLLFPGLAPQFPTTFKEVGLLERKVIESVTPDTDTGIVELAEGEDFEDEEADEEADLPEVELPQTTTPEAQASVRKRGEKALADIAAE